MPGNQISLRALQALNLVTVSNFMMADIQKDSARISLYNQYLEPMGNQCMLCLAEGKASNEKAVSSNSEDLNSAKLPMATVRRNQVSGRSSMKETIPTDASFTSNSLDVSGVHRVKGYEILGQLGAGAFGRVYKVKNSQNSLLAMKKILVPKNYSLDQVAVEARAMIRAQHASVIRVEEFFFWAENTELIIVMEFGQKDLRNFLKAKSPNLSKNMFTIMLQIAEGIQHLHSINIIHRDLKPENILLVKDRVKITDFGMAKIIENDMTLKTQAGTPLYLAPEILNGAGYTEKVDVWSLGIIFLEIASGKQITELVNTPFPALGSNFPSRSLPHIKNSEARKIIAKMLQKKPQNRSSMKQVIYQLNRLAEKQKIQPGLQKVEQLLYQKKNKEAAETFLKSWDGQTSLAPWVSKMRKQGKGQSIACLASELWVKNHMVVVCNFDYKKNETPDRMKIGRSNNQTYWLYVGDFLNGKMNGLGKTMWSDGQSYQGGYKDDKQHGEGTYIFKNGDVYEGAWNDDEMTGQGMYRYKQGDWYKGQHLCGLRHGHGVYFYHSTGEKYEGQWKNDKKDGKGVYMRKNGRKFSGQYTADQLLKEEPLSALSKHSNQIMLMQTPSMKYKKRKVDILLSRKENPEDKGEL